MPSSRLVTKTLYSTFLLLGTLVCFAEKPLQGSVLQADLDAGKNIVLNPGQVVVLKESLKFRTPNQRIETVGAKDASQYATIVHAAGPQGTLIEAKGIAGVVLTKLVLDANRPGFKHPEGKLTFEPMLSFGGEGAVGQEIRHCLVLGGRCAGGWGAIHLHEGGKDNIVKDNIVFSAGSDIRGNGRSLSEVAFGWGDGVSTGSRNTIIENNLIYDATDEGIMLQGAPGSQVRGNVMVSVGREMLGGIALVDPFGYYLLDKTKKTYDYSGIVIEDNLILAKGGRVHSGIPLGGSLWEPSFGGTTFVGATVRNNHISGDAFGYGYVVKGVDQFEITGNTSDATFSGLGDGHKGVLPDPPQAFMYDPAEIGTSKLQKEFIPQTKSLVRVLRCTRYAWQTRNAIGYRDQPYPDQEARAVVNMAFVEMLGRDATDSEAKHWVKWLQETKSNTDTIRRNLLATPEFVSIHGYVDPLNLHVWRNNRWLKLIRKTCSAAQAKGAEWPNAREWNETLLKKLRR